MELKLPNPNLKGEKSLEECIYERESVRSYKDKEIEIEKISQILWAAQGKKGHKRTVPSAGATFPLEIYITLKDKGFFHYNFEKHLLELITSEDLSKKLAQASWDQNFIAEAYLNVIICAIFERTTQRYGERGVRYVFIEVGHCAQNIHLEAVSLGLASVPIGAYEDNKVKDVLDLKKKIEPLYIIPVGYPK
ncbi:MAG: SagB/ThcOx family dehydrogenase [Candidatus Lokiarchaeota archaeon]|nr:SagB/ThcOx family dehydrogenase [Candidatus Lokiarchaeota archaeon]